ncbi:hypothetical protein AAIR98_000783 [Elusimicrobium simillimum]|uniref:hypothetical protein n=1 Tax=Elusimicrobium simillimum TaxID=3143438 RepID=UPI003C6EF5A8
MKKRTLIIITVLSLLSASAWAEGIRLRNGTIVTGSILEQTQYTLNLQTKYGVITIAQREIVEILPDKHRVVLKGGGEVVGTIEDIDEFNVRVKTDDAYVNIDMPRVSSIEVYDYEQAETQKKFVEKQIQQAQQQETRSTKEQNLTGLVFDEELDKSFAAKTATAAAPLEYTIVRDRTTPASTATITAGSTQDVYKAPVMKDEFQNPQPAAAKAVKEDPEKKAKEEKKNKSTLISKPP